MAIVNWYCCVILYYLIFFFFLILLSNLVFFFMVDISFLLLFRMLIFHWLMSVFSKFFCWSFLSFFFGVLNLFLYRNMSEHIYYLCTFKCFVNYPELSMTSSVKLSKCLYLFYITSLVFSTMEDQEWHLKIKRRIN